MIQKVGSYSDLLEKIVVVYTHTYTMPDGRRDISTEKYLFKGERSYGLYHVHQRTLPDLEGRLSRALMERNFG
ncbi:hypothetical protein OKW21_001690 [Catalinimonas alkaloidigena]|uniref:hypothetical protein n=1 Tax=Catalinimonas alkaloidigena TaxID=1075417 RepID=UPI002406E8CA|nr:hypothetical protein [Catalinimonas alkaloidigena]MDF9796427.1 hypothetical protein [Catalinimonas alkaloidigena]